MSRPSQTFPSGTIVDGVNVSGLPVLVNPDLWYDTGYMKKLAGITAAANQNPQVVVFADEPFIMKNPMPTSGRDSISGLIDDKLLESDLEFPITFLFPILTRINRSGMPTHYEVMAVEVLDREKTCKVSIVDSSKMYLADDAPDFQESFSRDVVGPALAQSGLNVVGDINYLTPMSQTSADEVYGTVDCGAYAQEFMRNVCNFGFDSASNRDSFDNENGVEQRGLQLRMTDLARCAAQNVPLDLAQADAAAYRKLQEDFGNRKFGITSPALDLETAIPQADSETFGEEEYEKLPDEDLLNALLDLIEEEEVASILGDSPSIADSIEYIALCSQIADFVGGVQDRDLLKDAFRSKLSNEESELSEEFLENLVDDCIEFDGIVRAFRASEGLDGGIADLDLSNFQALFLEEDSLEAADVEDEVLESSFADQELASKLAMQDAIKFLAQKHQKDHKSFCGIDLSLDQCLSNIKPYLEVLDFIGSDADENLIADALNEKFPGDGVRAMAMFKYFDEQLKSISGAEGNQAIGLKDVNLEYFKEVCNEERATTPLPPVETFSHPPSPQLIGGMLGVSFANVLAMAASSTLRDALSSEPQSTSFSPTASRGASVSVGGGR